MQGTEKKYFCEYETCNYMYPELYTRKRIFCKNAKFGSVALALYYVSYFNASLSRYHLVNLFCITICKVIQSSSYFNQELR